MGEKKKSFALFRFGKVFALESGCYKNLNFYA